MSIMATKIDGFVGAGLFFEHVSARAAFLLGAHHDRGLVKGNGARSTLGRSDSGIYTEYFVNERSINWNGYDGANPILPAADDRILLDIVPNLTQLGPIHVSRSTAVAHALINSESEGALATPAAINADLLPVGAAAVFPPFDLFASAMHMQEDTLEDGSWPGVQLITAAEMTAPLTVSYPMNAAILPRTSSQTAWAIWMKPSVDLVADSGVSIWMDSQTTGK